jgi:hypothetical protein
MIALSISSERSLFSLPFKGKTGEGMVLTFDVSSKPIPTQTLPLKGRASERAAIKGAA